MSDEKAIALTVLSKTVWSDTLFSFTTTRPEGFRFEAGQFVRLGVNPSKLSANQGKSVPDERIFRAYSVASSPYDEVLEFFSVVVPDGAFTSQLQHLQANDTLWLNPTPFGFLTLSRYQEPAPKTLWLLSTGTGLAPFLSMLQDLYTWETYQNIILVYSARTSRELAYQDKIRELGETFALMSEQTVNFKYIPIVTREAVDGCLQARIPTLIEQGELERAAGIALDADSHVMLCGNPAMIDDTKEALKAKGLTMNRRGVGNIAVENYW